MKNASPFTKQIELAHRLISEGKMVLAAAALGGLVGAGEPESLPADDVYAMSIRDYVACVLIELERGHRGNAALALECMAAIYCEAPLRVLEGDAKPTRRSRKRPALRLLVGGAP
jgi:hypothetical protein